MKPKQIIEVLEESLETIEQILEANIDVERLGRLKEALTHALSLISKVKELEERVKNLTKSL